MITIGILTFHRAKNYGAFLQSYALCSRLNEEADIKAEIIDFQMEKEKKRYRLSKNPVKIAKKFKLMKFKYTMYKKFDEMYKTAPFSEKSCISDRSGDFKNFIKGKYDIIIVGSDEVWKLGSFRGFPNVYFLPFKTSCKKVSYAVSSRSDFGDLSEADYRKLKNYLNDFDIVTVRDDITYEQVRKAIKTEKTVEMMPDPSFVYDFKANANRGRKLLAHKCGIGKNEKIAMIMVEDPEIANVIKRELPKGYKAISVFEYNADMISVPDLTPLEWFDVIAGADLILASYFHAVCFSVINNKQFLAFGTPVKKDKLMGVLKQFGLTDRFINIDDNLKKNGYLKGIINEKTKQAYDSTPDIIFQRERFKTFLNELRKIEME